VVILDLLMPHMNGWTFLERMRNDRRLCHLPVVVMSASPRIESEARLPAVRYLAKPICLATLLDVLERVYTQARRSTRPAPALQEGTFNAA